MRIIRQLGLEFAVKSTWLILGLITVATGSANAQDMQGFDPNAPAVPDFKLTPF